ncbi:MAG: hypothetical protein KKG99_14840 [Bacteroidetes bacterium]|nr:hypothetical protein [Bacteroidota bacterium]
MIKKAISIFIIMIITLSVKSQCKYYNKINADGKKTGLWLMYWDKEKHIPARRFHYKNDRESGVCKMYNSEGKLMMKERHLKKRIKVKNYNEHGKIQQKGYGILEFHTDKIRFYWHGHWKFYAENHHLTGISIYKDGVFIESKENRRTNKNQLTNKGL